ncbi:hypothetical protein [Pseudomonas putida]|uniref:hypothetical protein n=1 Tax=Pseudomonas putida TaxID=303 RepID=UPI003F689D63
MHRHRTQALQVLKAVKRDTHLGKQLQQMKRRTLRELATRYLSGLILQAKGCSPESFAGFFE